MPDCFWGGAPPWPRADFYEFNSKLCNVISDEMYSQYMYISNPQGAYWPNIRDAPEGKNQTADPSSPETQVNA